MARGFALERPRVLSSLKATHTGERLDRFELIAEIASGGMATVYLARLEGVAGFQRLFAIKRLHPHLANEAEFVDMFLDEARLAARIHHPNVVSILEVGMSDQGYYLVMDYIEGDTAARLLARASQASTRLPPGAAVRIALDTLFGLHAAHDLTDDDGRPLHIVHRDVSPQNVLVGIDGASRITDFGVAHAATRLSSTRTGQLKGKLAYMAPEQARGAVVDRRADVFAMGVVLWEMLAGKRLFKASNDAETLHRILFAPMPTLRGSGVDLPMPLDAVCSRALEREVENRYASCAEFADELERVARSLGMLFSTRDIATYVDGTIGAEISQQREVVRMWLSRSEPSRNDRLALSARRPSFSPSQSQSLPQLSASGALAAAPRALPRMSSRDVTVTETPSRAGPGPLAPTKRGEVSSLSSAVLEVVTEATTTDSKVLFPPPDLATPPAPPRRRRGGVLLWAVGGTSAAVVLLAAAALLVPRWLRGPEETVAASTLGPEAAGARSSGSAGGPASSSSVTPSGGGVGPSAIVATQAPSGVSSAHDARPDLPAAVPSSVVKPPSRPNAGGAKVPPHGRAPATAGNDDLPDDLSRNPYR